MPQPDSLTALEMLEYCRFAYKSYAQTCVYPMDPFYEAHGEGFVQGARDRVMAYVHNSLELDGDSHKFDPIEYDLKRTPDPSRGVVYRGGVGKQPYILFQPRKLDKSICYAKGVDLDGEDLPSVFINDAAGKLRCCFFQGRTGMTQTHPKAGWTSWFGAVVYDAVKETLVIAFRGSRSGSGGRAMGQALVFSQGSPDWVTDMNHLKEVKVPRFSNATLSAGFWLAYESCRKSLLGAIYEALNGLRIKEIHFTGHSLGGALAQCAYIDLVGGTLLDEGKALRKIVEKASISCYALSAPPIVLGAGSKEKIALHVGEMNVFHYFAPKDVVHDSAMVKYSAVKASNQFIGLLTHPLTKPVHIGTELPLEACDDGFPAAHEPQQVFEGLLEAIKKEKRMGYMKDPGFWPTFNFDPTGKWNLSVKHDWSGDQLEKELRGALANSVTSEGSQTLAALWAEIVKGEKKGGYLSLDDTDGEVFEDFTEACGLFDKVLVDPSNRAKHLEALKKSREALIKSYGGAKNHKASSSVYWVLLQYLTARQYCLGVA
ncbi:lipase family protein [Archangium sp.]|uniref:lipase family protein n=1 Tax=Archangium sp. TaxID=1872627 RepID=UPI003899E7C3